MTFSAEPLHDDDMDYQGSATERKSQNLVDTINNDLRTLTKNQFTASLDSIEALTKNLNMNSSDGGNQENDALVLNEGKRFPSNEPCSSPTFEESKNFFNDDLNGIVIEPKHAGKVQNQIMTKQKARST